PRRQHLGAGYCAVLSRGECGDRCHTARMGEELAEPDCRGYSCCKNRPFAGRLCQYRLERMYCRATALDSAGSAWTRSGAADSLRRIHPTVCTSEYEFLLERKRRQSKHGRYGRRLGTL